ncbi:N-6 DNA methylase [Bernardetia sp. Wsw4-3y2]|uniref:HsdM family class I SAM-dependent methyltransferase n=1 Tax=Bernardetia sp. Wsw4-3y2 TaxID=3127471 RepID=UPI0030D0E3B9
METNNNLEQLGLNRAISVFTDTKEVSESQNSVLTQVKDFDIDAVYFCTDEKNISYPAVFIKKTDRFDEDTFKKIAKIQQKIWNYKKVLFLYVYSETEIKIYNCAEKPLLIEKEDFDFKKEVKKIELESYEFSDKKDLQELNNLFSSIAIDTGTIWTIEEAAKIRKKINLQRRVDKYLVESLINTAKQLQSQGLTIDFIHKIIMRSLFLLYLEDRGATDKIFYSKIRKGAESYFDILDNVEDTYNLFSKLEEHFNGNVFTLEDKEDITVEQLQLIKKCFISGNDNTSQIKLFEDWRLFDFSIIQIELLSEIYEKFLSEIDKESKKQTGTFYTPPSLVELILNEKLPINNKEEKFNVKVLDPSCGSGIFLVESFKRLVKRYENNHNTKLTDFKILSKLLTDNIFGIEINSQSIKVAAFSLYLALVDNLNPKTIWQNKNYKLPYLINDLKEKSIKKQGKNLYCRDTISINEEIENIEFDLVVGNPPFGTKELLPSIKSYNVEHNFAPEMVLSFLHKAIKFAPDGEIALIFNTKVLTNTGSKYQNFRKWIFNECYVEKIYNFSILRNAPKNFGGQLFESVTVPISILFYRKETPKKPSDRITYYAPKTFIKTNIIEGISLDSTDVKYLPREECQNSNTKIWKIAMWGGTNDYNLINKLKSLNYNINDFTRDNDIIFGVGLQPINDSTQNPIVNYDIAKLKFIRPEKINRFFTEKSNFTNIIDLLKDENTINKYLSYYHKKEISELTTINVFRRVGATKVYNGPMVLTKEGFKDNKLCFSYIDSSVTFNSSVLGFHSKNSSHLRVLSALLNSELATYFLLLTSSSWGIERERIKPNEIYDFPLDKNIELYNNLVKIHKEIENDIKENDIYSQDENFEKKLNKLIYKLYKLSYKETIIIKDFLETSMDLFHKREKSKSLLPILETSEYATIFCNEINNFLEGDELFANATIYKVNRFSPLMMIKISFEDTKKEVFQSEEQLTNELKQFDKYLWEANSPSIYFRKKLNYKTGNDVYIIRPNQRRFWTKSMALEDASELILEILTDN